MKLETSEGKYLQRNRLFSIFLETIRIRRILASRQMKK